MEHSSNTPASEGHATPAFARLLLCTLSPAGVLALIYEFAPRSVLLGWGIALALALLLAAWATRHLLAPYRRAQALHANFPNTARADDSGKSSSDPFAALETLVQEMLQRSLRQEKVLALLAETDHSILHRSVMDNTKMELLKRLPQVLGVDHAGIVICDPSTGRLSRSFVLTKETVKANRFTNQAQPQWASDKKAQLESLRKRVDEIGWLDVWPIQARTTATYLPIHTKDGLNGLFVYTRPGKELWQRVDDTTMQIIAGRIGVSAASSQKEQQLFLQTRFDHLTHLPNRLLFSDRIVQEIARANRSGSMMALLYIDLDFFKQVNDSLGHSAGDHVLRTVASRLRSSVRESDTVARLSGDEFAVILADLLHVRDAGQLAGSIIQKLSEPFTIGTQQSFLCASIGIAIYPSDGQQPEALLRNADIAMYRAKEAGKGRYVFYEERMNRETHHLANLDRELRLAVESNQFELHFQPQVELRTGNVCGVEALLRWRHPERGLLPPAYFMAHAEASGLIEPLGELVLVTACAHYNRWREMKIAPPRFAINVSPRQFKRADFHRFVESTLKAAGIAPLHLEIEVTETVFMEESDQPRINIDKLAAMGVRIAIDDFGTGYSSLAYLKRLPFHLLKIDRSFVRDVNSDEDARTIASTIIAMAHSLRKEVLAEGVDHDDQIEFLRQEQCDQVQGYLVSQPVPEHDFNRFLREFLPTRFGAHGKLVKAWSATQDN